MRNKTKQIYIYAGILILILVATFFVLFSNQNKGTLQINTQEEDLKIFIDQKEKKSFSNKDGKINLSIKEGVHSLIIAKESSWPWAKAIKIEVDDVAEVSPFFVPKDTSGYIITEESEDYFEILALFNGNLINTSAQEFLFSEGSFEPKINAIDFYKDRDDVVVVGIKDGIYAIEVSNPENQNLQPIYKGENPLFVKSDNLSLYVKDGDFLMEIGY